MEWAHLLWEKPLLVTRYAAVVPTTKDMHACLLSIKDRSDSDEEKKKEEKCHRRDRLSNVEDLMPVTQLCARDVGG